MLKLYIISQTENNNYDTYDSAVVAATDEDSARLIHPDGHDGWSDGYLHTVWTSCPEKVQVKLIGDAAPDITPGIVLASFNAG